ncbi:MAG: GNAT family N-acetyltransferase [Alphaproteobacteria bacterium]|nr:GNAT family N-acetyltransferase [Alphaproteobacteria bacterium]
MTIEIVRATLDDLPAIQALSNDIFEIELTICPELIRDWPYSPNGERYFRDWIENHFFLVAKDNGKTIGYLSAKFDMGLIHINGTCAEIENVSVRESYRNQGIGRRLFEAFKTECRKHDISSIKIKFLTENEQAAKAYEAWGLKPWATVFNFDL